jgi:hypothetical protein
MKLWVQHPLGAITNKEINEFGEVFYQMGEASLRDC